MTKTEAQKALQIRTSLDMPGRKFVILDPSGEPFSKTFNYVDHGKQMLAFGADEVAMVADSFILYAARTLGCCTLDHLAAFLDVLKTKNPDFSICDTKDYRDPRKGFSNRLSQLKKYGYIYSVTYSLGAKERSATKQEDTVVSLYLVSEQGNMLMNRRLEKRIPTDRWSETAPLKELLGKAAVSDQVVRLMRQSYFVENLEGVFRDRYIGMWYLPGEMKFMVEDDAYYTMLIHGYMVRDGRYQNEKDFNEVNFNKVKLLNKYLSRRTKKGIANVIVCVMDNEDLMNFGYLLYDNREMCEEFLDQIYFTGEGANRIKDMKDRYLRLVFTGNDDDPINFEPATPAYVD